jgi:uncharacterized protein YjbI with pentapeptide repeats
LVSIKLGKVLNNNYNLAMGRSKGQRNKMAATLLGSSDASIRGFIDPEVQKESNFKKLLKELVSIQQASLARGKIPKDPRVLNLDDTDLNSHALYGLNLDGGSFQKTDFQDADIGYSPGYLGTSMQNTDCRGADFMNANLEGVSFNKADLEDASLKNTDLANTVFDGTNLCGVELNSSYIFESSFIETQINKKTSFANTEIKQTAFIDCYSLDDVSFFSSRLDMVRFIGQSFQRTFFKEVSVNDVFFSNPHSEEIDCREIDFSKSHIVDIHFHKKTRFANSNFSHTEVRDSYFKEPQFVNADLRYSLFKNVKFEAPKFKESNLTGSVFENCLFKGVDEKDFKDLVESLKQKGATVKNCSFE